MTTQHKLKPAKIGSISHGTLRTKDLIDSFFCELQRLMDFNADFFNAPENLAQRESLVATKASAEEFLNVESVEAEEFLNEELFEALQTFAPSYCYFGSHPGDGADFGFWPYDIEEIKEQIEFVSSKAEEYPPEDFTGEWLHVNDHGNCTLFCRTKEGKLILDSELWSLV